MEFGHNDHLVAGMRINTLKGSDLQGAEGRGHMGSNNAKSSYDFSETTRQLLIKLGHNDHIVVGDKNLYLKRVLPLRWLTVVLAET